MARKRSTRIVASYVLSLVVTIALLVGWVVYIARSVSMMTRLAGRVGMEHGRFHWIVLAVGCLLFFFLIVGLTYQLALTFAERRYSETQDEFISHVTHELKSPLAAIRLHAQTLAEGDLEAEDRARSVGYILEQADRMADLVDDILVESRLRTQRTLLDPVPVAIGEFFPSYLEEAGRRVEAQGLRLSARIESEAVVMATPDVLQRIMDNLFDNAMRFSIRGGEVRCRVVDRSSKVVIEVEDDGIGIPKSELPKIFDRFYQIRTEWTGRRKGSGLGLSIVSGLVSELSGTVEAFSQEGRPGARFVVELPMMEAAA